MRIADALADRSIAPSFAIFGRRSVPFSGFHSSDKDFSHSGYRGRDRAVTAIAPEKMR
jgi:hypothetical protein